MDEPMRRVWAETEKLSLVSQAAASPFAPGAALGNRFYFHTHINRPG